MSGSQAIAAVTNALRVLIQTRISADSVVGSGQVTARPPDLARSAGAGNQVNVFMYRTAIDAAWRNQDPPTVRPGEIAQPALPLILSYVITAYGENDDEILSHRLLGLAMTALNDQPVLSRSLLRTALPGSGLDTQPERVRVVAHPVPQDELSRMWSTFQTGYRISVTYDAAVVLLDSLPPPTTALPVLGVGRGDTGPTALPSLPPDLPGLPPRLSRIDSPSGHPAAVTGDLLTVSGHNLGAVTEVRITGLRSPQPVTITAPALTVSPAELTFVVPKTVTAGSHAVSAAIGPGSADQVSAELPFAVAPTITDPSPFSATIPAGRENGSVPLTVHCDPPVVADQNVALMVGSMSVPPSTTPPAAALEFTIPGVARGRYPVRLRVDLQDSLLLQDGQPPTFHMLEVT